MARIIAPDTPLFDKKSLSNLMSSVPSYQADGDTFFASPEVPVPAVSYDIEGEIWVRFDPQTKEIIGLEIENFESIFLKKHPELSKLWKEAKPYCVDKRSRSGSEKVCDSFVLGLIEFFSTLLKNKPQQSAFGLP